MDDVIIINRLPEWDDEFDAKKWNTKFLETNVILNSDVYEAVYPVHWGPLSLKFAFNGCEYYETDNCRYRVTDGRFLLLNQDQLYESSVVSDKAVRSFTVNFCPEFKGGKFAELVASELKLLDDPEYESIKELNFFSKLYSYDTYIAKEIFELKNYIDGLNYNSLYINEKLSNILEGIYKLNCRVLKDTEGVAGGKVSTRIETYRRITRAKDYIDSNFMKEVSLETLGKVSSMNQFHFLRKFKQFYSKTPHQYLTEVRLREAKAFLKKKKYSVTEVCMEVGFEDPASFSKLFKRSFGVSPIDYRN
jgi:AraC family transcriptional regulator